MTEITEQSEPAYSPSESLESEPEPPAYAEEPVAKAADVLEERSELARPDGNLITNVLSILKASMLPNKFDLISNPLISDSSMDGDVLTVGASSGFVKGQLEQAQSAIKSAAEQVTGRTINVKIVESRTAPAANPKKLDELTKFGNVKFE